MATPPRVPDAQPADYLPTLDGWRAVAVFMVIACHALGSRLPRFKPFGGEGVSIFFALSGLLICNRLLAEYGRTGRLDLAGFYVRRAFRILPPALAYLAALALLTLAGVGAAAPSELGACLLLCRNYFAGEGWWYTGHFWSLAVEEHFYLFFPVLLAWAGPRRTLPLAVGLALVLIGWRWLDLRWMRLYAWTSAVPQYYRTDCRLPDLLLGAVTALLASRAPAGLVRIAGIAGAAALVARLALGLPVPWTVSSVLLPWMLLSTVQRPAGWVGQTLEWAPLVWVGRRSYSLYLWQQLFFHGPERFRLTGLGPLQDWPWNLLALFACAAASHALLERPLTRLGRSLARRRAAAPAPQGDEALRSLIDHRQSLAQPRYRPPVIVHSPTARRL
jgi:peptidoglycan/LPS O-acetylase OafA/YrhL